MDCKPRLQATGFGKNNTDACGLIPETSIYPGVTVTENHSNELRRVARRTYRTLYPRTCGAPAMRRDPPRRTVAATSTAETSPLDAHRRPGALYRLPPAGEKRSGSQRGYRRVRAAASTKGS